MIQVIEVTTWRNSFLGEGSRVVTEYFTTASSQKENVFLFGEVWSSRSDAFSKAHVFVKHVFVSSSRPSVVRKVRAFCVVKCVKFRN